ncbi:hypothetical protein E3T28_07120 [Cryobacterium sinapicolor]|uniref:Uncharacterized protein n=1 Tax=Cryobacterium sinapicolor TaxID=1259236 RepID=A0ABY2J8P2_9MICO|nr:hypothetical protein [Cryobacterium sinapicolor]TFD01320.1 hypothetical protein E3T28_07120 [Cryobacterium sinapicolor]
MSTDQILASFARYRPGVDLAEVFFEEFVCHLPAVLNQSHLITIVAETVDPNTESTVRLLQRGGFPINLVSYRYYPDLGAIEFSPYPRADQDAEAFLATKESGEPGSTRLASAGELARLHALLDRVDSSLEEFRPALELLRRPSSAATTYRPVAGMGGSDQYILLFWLTYAWRFTWDFVPFSFLHELYQHWVRAQAAEGLRLPMLKPEVFGQRLAAAATATGEWNNTRRRPEDLMDAPEPLTELVPGWKRPEKDQHVHGYLKSGIVGRASDRWSAAPLQ